MIYTLIFIDEPFFTDGALLADEYDNLYNALFNKPAQYLKIISVLSQARNGLTREEIIKKTHIASSGAFSKKLEELENCDFIRKYIPYGKKDSSYIYQLIDNYILFYHKFLKKNHFEEHFWQNQINTSAINSRGGLAFEKVCLEHVPQIKKALGISGVYTDVNAWQCSADEKLGIEGAQIDLMLVRKDQIINLCEMKYTESSCSERICS